jgi:putative transcription factor
MTKVIRFNFIIVHRVIKMKRQTNKPIDCEFCGKSIHTEPIIIKVEGALLNVCNNCKQFGKVVENKPSSPTIVKKPVQTKNTQIQQIKTPPKRYKSPTTSSRGSLEDQGGESLISDFGNIIRNARLKKKLNQKNLADLTGISVAQIQSFESGKMRPTDMEAKKIERELSIKLFEELDLDPEYTQSSKVAENTLGDFMRKTDLDKLKRRL